MAKIIFFNFDGTDNDPKDADQELLRSGGVEDESISNILKFHLLLGGQLQEKNGNTLLENGSRSFYYSGVGTYGNIFQRLFNSGLASERSDVAKILRMAKKDFSDHFKPDGYDYIVVTGFSRGAALARRFASVISDQLDNKQIIIEGVFDTVASIGLPNMSRSSRPSSDVVFEHGHSLSSNVLRALHLVSLDDKRKAFQPTLMNQEPHIAKKESQVTEVWFAGAHSDVGGSYNFDGLSDITLRYMLDWFEDQSELNITFKSSKNINYNEVFPAGSKVFIGADDVQIDPNPFGVNHQQERMAILKQLTLDDRVCCVIRNDKILKDALPMVHSSVAERIGGDNSYKPRSLKNKKHIICYSDLTTKEFSGYSEHKLKFMSNLKVLASDPIETRIYAHLKFNHTGIYLTKGKTYKIEVIEKDTQRWRDGSIHPVTGRGWDRGDVKLGLKELVIRGMEPFRRVTDDGVKWFTLCGCIGNDDDNAFIIGNYNDHVQPKKSGELCAFANDLDGYYGNNSGYLKIRVTAMNAD